ncbi:MAG: hypothetical protein AAFO95_09785, partial [Cyanobacteria bacterium J06600_6]
MSLESCSLVIAAVKSYGFDLWKLVGEIEAVLNQHPSVQTSIVIPHEQNLIAYCIPQQASTSQIRSFLQQQLPSYMIPG